MSVITTQAPVVPEPASEAANRPTINEILQNVVPLLLFVPFAGPPAILLVGPLLLFVLLLIPPAALLITFMMVFLVVAATLAALGALIASPYLLVRHLRARHALAHSEAGGTRVAGASHAAPTSQSPAVTECILEPTASPVGA